MNVYGRYNAICPVFVGQTARQPCWYQSIELWSGGALISACLLNQLSCRLDFRTEWCDQCVVMLKVAGMWPFPGAQRPLGPPYFQFHLSVNKTCEESKGHIVNLLLCVCVCVCVFARGLASVCVCVSGPVSRASHQPQLLPRQTFYNTVRDSQSNSLCASVIQQRSGDSLSGVAAQIKAANTEKKSHKRKGDMERGLIMIPLFWMVHTTHLEQSGEEELRGFLRTVLL